jgi:hypothetical protein
MHNDKVLASILSIEIFWFPYLSSTGAEPVGGTASVIIEMDFSLSSSYSSMIEFLE